MEADDTHTSTGLPALQQGCADGTSWMRASIQAGTRLTERAQPPACTPFFFPSEGPHSLLEAPALPHEACSPTRHAIAPRYSPTRHAARGIAPRGMQHEALPHEACSSCPPAPIAQASLPP